MWKTKKGGKSVLTLGSLDSDDFCIYSTDILNAFSFFSLSLSFDVSGFKKFWALGNT